MGCGQSHNDANRVFAPISQVTRDFRYENGNPIYSVVNQFVNTSSAVIEELRCMGVEINEFHTAMLQRTFHELIETPVVTNALTSTAMFNTKSLSINAGLTDSVPFGFVAAAVIIDQITGSTPTFCEKACKMWLDEMENVSEAANHTTEVVPVIESYIHCIPHFLSRVLLLYYFNMDIVDVVIIGLENFARPSFFNIRSRLDIIRARDDILFINQTMDAIKTSESSLQQQ
jgi:hypothetical protein